MQDIFFLEKTPLKEIPAISIWKPWQMRWRTELVGVAVLKLTHKTGGEPGLGILPSSPLLLNSKHVPQHQFWPCQWALFWLLPSHDSRGWCVPRTTAKISLSRGRGGQVHLCHRATKWSPGGSVQNRHNLYEPEDFREKKMLSDKKGYWKYTCHFSAVKAV